MTECLKTNTVEDLLAPVHPFLDHSSTSASITIQSDLFEAYMSALDYWRICLDAVCAEDGDDKQDGLAFGAFLDPGVQAMTQLLDFVEVATIPSSWDFEPDGDDRMEDGEQDGQEDEQPEDNSRADFEKILSKAKASAVGMVGLISWELPYGTCDDFWARMRSWADRQDERDDLVNCALVALANGARSSESCYAPTVKRDADFVRRDCRRSTARLDVDFARTCGKAVSIDENDDSACPHWLDAPSRRTASQQGHTRRRWGHRACSSHGHI